MSWICFTWWQCIVPELYLKLPFVIHYSHWIWIFYTPSASVMSCEHLPPKERGELVVMCKHKYLERFLKEKRKKWNTRFSGAGMKHLIWWGRILDIIFSYVMSSTAGNHHRPYLQFQIEGTNSYINAVYVNVSRMEKSYPEISNIEINIWL